MVNEPDQVALLNYRTERTIAIVGAILMLGKFFAYFITGSVSILTDALESIVNVIAGIIGVFALWMCLVPADREHPYGHGKMELLSSAAEGLMILIAGGLIIIESVNRILNPAEIRQIDIGLLIVVLAAAVNFVMGMNAIRRGRKTGSLALVASGKHLCTDTFSSLGIIIGLVLIWVTGSVGMDTWWLDPVTAALFGVFIIVTGVGVVKNSVLGIIDTADEEILEKVTQALNNVRTPEVIDIHHLRVVCYGPLIHVEAHMVVPDYTRQSRVDQIRGVMTAEIRRELGTGVDVTLQSESCDFLSCRYCEESDCSQRTGAFRSLVKFDLDSVTSETSPTQHSSDTSE